MNTTKHSPGPWKRQHFGGNQVIHTLDGWTVARINIQQAEGQAVANAHLIAAAPELLEALRLAQSVLADYCRSRGDDWETTEEPDDEVSAYRAVQRAIAKAEGRA